MYSKWIKSGFILAILLVSMVSLSMAACPWFIKNELYTAQCGVEKVVPASAGLLANDPGAVAVLNPAGITIDPKYGTLVVNADGSFVYNPNPDMTSGTYVQFKYNATNGACAATYAGLAKIQVSCKCRPNVKDITLCWTPATTLEQIKQKIIAAGVDCIGCGAAATVLDLSQIELAPGTYPYLLKCPGCQDAVGWVTLVPGCEADAPDFAFCEGTVTLAQLQGMINAQADCIGTGCDQSPLINTANVNVSGGFVTGGSYTATCGAGSECADTDTGIITVFPKCVVNAPPVEICEERTLEQLVDAIEAKVPGCTGVGCDASPILSYENVSVDEETGFVTGGAYTVTCTTGNDCVSSADGDITVTPKCEVILIGVSVQCVTPAQLEAEIKAENPSPCGDCDTTPLFEFPVWPLRTDGSGFVANGVYEYTVTCNAGGLEGCDSSETGEVIVDCLQPCACIAVAPSIPVCPNEVTIDELEDMIDLVAKCNPLPGAPRSTCDTSPEVNTNGVNVSNGYVTGGSYTVTCQPTEDCDAIVATGTVTLRTDCCKCEAVAPTIEVCPNKVKIPELEGMIAKEAACDDLPGAVCTATPQISTTGVTVDANGYVTGGTYTVTCPSDVSSCTDVTTGTVSVVDSPECHPPCTCQATAPDVCIQIVYSGGYHQYTYAEVLAAVKKQGATCAASCSDMSLTFYNRYGTEIPFSTLDWTNEHKGTQSYKYKVVCENSDGSCTAESGKSKLEVKWACPC